jgi:DNA-binding Lrp family transcriptional regulator
MAQENEAIRNSLETLDYQIVSALQEDARSSYRDIARKIGIAVGTVQSRVRKLLDAKVIRGFSVELDYSKMGLPLSAVILLQVKGKRLREVEAKLASIENVCAVYDITGDFDVAMVAKFPDSVALDKFIKEILAMDYVERTATSIVLNTVKEEYNIKITPGRGGGRR